MKFFHVYNDDCFKGLEKNGLINKDTGFKIQHAYSVPQERLFNCYAAENSKLYGLIKEGDYPFYVDRVTGGVPYFPYKFDKKLIRKYRELLGDWFLGFQLHESASNRRFFEWQPIMQRMGGKGPFDPVKLEFAMRSTQARMADGTPLWELSHDDPAYFATLRYAETYEEYLQEVVEMFARRAADTDNNVLPCDSFYLLPKLQDEMGMRTFMPEVGSQIPLMRIAVALARGVALSSRKTWGTYYECWRHSIGGFDFNMPCFNPDPINEWYLPQEQFPFDFSTTGANGGSSRLLQNRIYYYALMSGADYFSEEWGLNCSYSSMQTFELSHYGQVKKDFIRVAENLQGIKATTPFAIILPKKYICVELPELFDAKAYYGYRCGVHRDVYMRSPLNEADKAFFGHIEDVIKLFFARLDEQYGNEGHVLTNSRFGDLFDIIYEDADDQTLGRYEYLIDATKEGSFIKAKANSTYQILDSSDLAALEAKVHALEKTCMPCVVDGLHWLVSTDEKGQHYLSIFNNEGNTRSLAMGDELDHQADRRVMVTFRNNAQLHLVSSSGAGVALEKADGQHSYVTVPAAGFAVMNF